MDVAPGTRVGSYVFEDVVGAGAFGVVYSGRHVTTAERVAIKVLSSGVAADAETVARFRREARMLTRIRSDFVAKLVDFRTDPELGMLLIMEFMEGELLSDLAEVTSLTVEDALSIGIDVARGVADIHAAGIIHRDIKPANIILKGMPDGSRRAVILDFGLSRRVEGADGAALMRVGTDESIDLTAAGMAIGTPEFMAPEQLVSARDVSVQSDVYAVGAVLYRLVAAAPAYEGTTDIELAHSKVTCEARALDTCRDDAVAKRFEAVVNKAMQYRPADRYASARELLDALVEVQELRADLERRASEVTQRVMKRHFPMEREAQPASPPPRRGSAMFIGIAVFAAAAIGVAGYLLTRG